MSLKGKSFDVLQRREIDLGLVQGLDIEAFAKPELTWEQMRKIRTELLYGNEIPSDNGSLELHHEIRSWMEQGLDIRPYLIDGFNVDELEDILHALCTDVEIWPYDRLSMPRDKRHIILWGFVYGKDYTACLDKHYTDEQLKKMVEQLGTNEDLDIPAPKPGMSTRHMRQIELGMEQGVDTRAYANPAFSPEQMKEIRLGLLTGVDFSKYAKPELSVKQMKEIRFGLDFGVNVSLYNKPSYSDFEMKLIRISLEHDIDITDDYYKGFNAEQIYELILGKIHGVDTSIYHNPEYDNLQMFQIRVGLEQGVDVSSYTKPEFNHNDMGGMRHKGLVEKMSLI